MEHSGKEENRDFLFRLFFDIETKAGIRLESAIQVLIVANVFFMMFPLPGTFESTNGFLEWLCVVGECSENWFLLIFSLELTARSWTAFKYKRDYFYSRWFLIDALAVIPSIIFYFSAATFSTQAIRILRIFRIFKMEQLKVAGAVMEEVVKRSRDELVSTMAIIVSMLLGFSILMTFLESHHSDDAFSHAWASMWWAVATLTTVGYGDVVPESILGKIAGGLICLSGVLTFALPTAILSSSFVEVMGESKGAKKTPPSDCPHCGESFEKVRDST